MSHYFKLISSETRDVTPQLAAEFSTMPASTTERDLKAKRMDYLKDAVLDGRAIAFGWSVATVLEDGVTYRVNGHHSSTMLAKLNGQLPEGLKAHIDTYEVPDKNALVLLFRQLDSRMSARSVDDVAGAYQGVHADLLPVPKPAARKAVEGLTWYRKNKIGSDVPNGDDRFEAFHEVKLHPFIQMTGRILSVKTPEFVTPVVGAMFGTYDRDPSLCEEFWSDVAKQGGGNSSDHPAVTLDAWLVDARQQKEDKPKEEEIFHACAVAWNAFRNHRSLDRIPRFSAKKGAPELD